MRKLYVPKKITNGLTEHLLVKVQEAPGEEALSLLILKDFLKSKTFRENETLTITKKEVLTWMSRL